MTDKEIFIDGVDVSKCNLKADLTACEILDIVGSEKQE